MLQYPISLPLCVFWRIAVRGELFRPRSDHTTLPELSAFHDDDNADASDQVTGLLETTQ